jgi:hypothetical protein
VLIRVIRGPLFLEFGIWNLGFPGQGLRIPVNWSLIPTQSSIVLIKQEAALISRIQATCHLRYKQFPFFCNIRSASFVNPLREKINPTAPVLFFKPSSPLQISYRSPGSLPRIPRGTLCRKYHHLSPGNESSRPPG